MEIKRAVLTVLAAGALIVAGGCKTTSTTNGSLNNQPALQSGETGQITTGTTATTDSSPSVTTNTTSYSTPSYSTPAATTLTTTTTTPSTTTDANGTTTTTMASGSTVTRSETTTVVYPDGTVKTLTPNESAALGTTTAPNGTQLVNMPAGSAVVTKTVTTITTPPPQNTIVTTTVPVTSQTPMTSSTSTIAYPYPAYNTSGRRIPGLDFLVFADRASFSQTNSFPGTLNTGDIRSDIRNQTGYGLGINAWFNRHFSGEITASRIHPQTNFIPANAGVNPITGLRVRMTPITGTLQLHFNPYSTVDAYLGGGAAYVLFKADQSSFNAGTTGLTSINFRDEWGPLVNGGLGFNISRHFGINLDAKYMWIRARANTTFNTATIGNVGNTSRWGLNPLLISAGLRFGF